MEELKGQIRTFEDLEMFEYDPSKYEYQTLLTRELDSAHPKEFNQSLINEIVLWKVNRYAHLSEELMSELNDSRLRGDTLDVGFTREILRKLLLVDGVRLAMASTILRFRNPQLYQIFDQRAYRFAYGQAVEQTTYAKGEKYLERQVDLYMDYLSKLRDISIQYRIDFETIDRLFYLKDIEMNDKFPIKY
jgi:hypothetical protein